MLQRPDTGLLWKIGWLMKCQDCVHVCLRLLTDLITVLLRWSRYISASHCLPAVSGNSDRHHLARCEFCTTS